MIKIAEDKSNKEIADELFVTEATIKSHVSSIYKKCQVKNRRELKRLLQKEIYMF